MNYANPEFNVCKRTLSANRVSAALFETIRAKRADARRFVKPLLLTGTMLFISKITVVQPFEIEAGPTAKQWRVSMICIINCEIHWTGQPWWHADAFVDCAL